MQGALERHRVVSPSSRVLCPQLAALCDYLGTSGLGVAGTACKPVQGSFGWKIIGNGAAPAALPGAFLVCLVGRESKVGRNRQGAREERSGLQYSSKGVRRPPKSNILIVETRGSQMECGGAQKGSRQ